MPDGMPGLTEGRIVHYVMEDAEEHRQQPDGTVAWGPAHRPAIIIKVWDRERGTVNLQVFTDGSNDGAFYESGIAWKTSRVYSEGKESGTWHWIEQA